MRYCSTQYKYNVSKILYTKAQIEGLSEFTSKYSILPNAMTNTWLDVIDLKVKFYVLFLISNHFYFAYFSPISFFFCVIATCFWFKFRSLIL